MRTNTKFQEVFAFENVDKAYNGRQGCMCGCNGDYAYTHNDKEDWQGDVNMTKVKRRYNKVMNSENKVVDVYASCVYVDDGDRTTVVYFK